MGATIAGRRSPGGSPSRSHVAPLVCRLTPRWRTRCCAHPQLAWYSSPEVRDQPESQRWTPHPDPLPAEMRGEGGTAKRHSVHSAPVRNFRGAVLGGNRGSRIRLFVPRRPSRPRSSPLPHAARKAETRSPHALRLFGSWGCDAERLSRCAASPLCRVISPPWCRLAATVWNRRSRAWAMHCLTAGLALAPLSPFFTPRRGSRRSPRAPRRAAPG
jgi:hypothetical protein